MIKKSYLFASILFFLTYSLCFAKPPIFITLTAPPSGTLVNKTVPLEAQIDRIPRVKSVKFYIDNKLAGEDDTAPYQYSWDTTSYPDGQHQIYASILQAPDRPEPFDEKSMTVLDSPRTNLIVDNTPPLILITSPLNNSSVSGAQTITVSGTIDDNQATVTVNGSPAAVSDGTFSSQVTLTNGKNTITAIATDLIGNSSSVSINVVYDNTAPATPLVFDDGKYTTPATQLHACWIPADPESGITENQYSIGTTPGGTEVVGWTTPAVPTDTEVTHTGLLLNHGQTYYFNVKSKNGAGTWSEIGSSDGIIVNAHAPVINSVTPQANSTFATKTQVSISVNAQDADGDPLEYRFLVDDKIAQDWSSSSSYLWNALPTNTLIRKITCQVRDDKEGQASQDVNYNVQIDKTDTTPPSTPVVTTDEYSNSLDSLHASWSAEDPESGIVEFQYAIGTTPGGTDVVDWTSAGANTEITHYDLNLIEGQKYYFTVRTINGVSLLSTNGYSAADEAERETIIKITDPQNSSLITGNFFRRVKGIAKGTTELTVNNKHVTVGPDGTFEGPMLVPPGYAKWNNIPDNDDYIIMNFPGPTTITASANHQEDTVTVYYYQFFMKTYSYSEGYDSTIELRGWNSYALTECPFNEFYPADYPMHRYRYSGYPWSPWLPDPGSALGAIDYLYRLESTEVINPPYSWRGRCTSSFTIHTLPAVRQGEPMVIFFNGCRFCPVFGKNNKFPDISSFTVNGKSLIYYRGDLHDVAGLSAYVVLDQYEPNIDLPLDIECPDFTFSSSNLTYHYQGLGVAGIGPLRIDLIVDGMPEDKEETDGAVIYINANYDEHNGDTKQLEDFRSDGIVANDFNLLSASLDITDAGIGGNVQLVYPQDKILIWAEDYDGNYYKIKSGEFYPVDILPIHQRLKIEAIDGSKTNKDITIAAQFIPYGTNSNQYVDRACLTSIKTEFMLTFDDGPFANKTMNVVNDLSNFYVNGEKVKAAFFMVGEDGSEHAWYDLVYSLGIEGIDGNPTIPSLVANAGHYVGNHTKNHMEFYNDDATRENIRKQIFECNSAIRTALGGTPNPLLFRPPYLSETSDMYGALEDLRTTDNLDYFIVWGQTGWGECNWPLEVRSWKQIAKNTTTYLKKWNTREKPNNRSAPAIICYHEFHEAIWPHVKDIVKYLQDNGYVLETFNKNKCVEYKPYYEKP